MNRISLIVLAASIATAACQSERPTEPLSPAEPESPPSPSAPASSTPSSPANPKSPAGPSAAIVSPGVYRLLAPITSFDPIWGDFTEYVYAATLTVEHHSRNAARLVGTFSDFTLLDAEGKAENWSHAGTLEGFVDSLGEVTFELRNYDGNFTWWGRGAVTASRIDGSWGRGGHLAGPFSAVLNK